MTRHSSLKQTPNGAACWPSSAELRLRSIGAAVQRATATMKRRYLFAALLTLSMAVDAQPPDFAAVDSKEKLTSLAAEGKLERVHLFPLELGGKDTELNVVYLPIGLLEIKKKIDRTVVKMARDGTVTKLTVDPVYKGKSFVPSRIVIKASHPDKPGGLDTTIEVW